MNTNIKIPELPKAVEQRLRDKYKQFSTEQAQLIVPIYIIGLQYRDEDDAIPIIYINENDQAGLVVECSPVQAFYAGRALYNWFVQEYEHFKHIQLENVVGTAAQIIDKHAHFMRFVEIWKTQETYKLHGLHYDMWYDTVRQNMCSSFGGFETFVSIEFPTTSVTHDSVRMN